MEKIGISSFLGFDLYIDGRNDRDLRDNLQWGPTPSIFLTSNIKTSDRIEMSPVLSVMIKASDLAKIFPLVGRNEWASCFKMVQGDIMWIVAIEKWGT